MSYSAAGAEVSLAETARRQNALSLLIFVLFVVALLLRFCIPPQLMNVFVDYTEITGAFYEKLHFGTYAILLLLPVALFSRPIRLAGDEIGKFKALVRFTAVLLGLIALLMLTGRAGSSGFLIDSYLVAAAAGLILMSLPEDLRRMVGNAILGMLLLSVVVAIVEVVTQSRLFPHSESEDAFRPLGLSGHPLMLGMLSATGIGFVVLTRWRNWMKVAAILLLLLGCVVSGARFSLLLAGAEVLALLILVPWAGLSPRHERQAKFLVLLVTVGLGALLVALLLAGGLLNRFTETLFDENFMARITVYRVFEFTSFGDLMLGTDLNRVLAIVNKELDLPIIESTPVYLIYLMGLPLALAFAALVLWIFMRLLRFAGRPAWIAWTVFMLAALSNNALSTKSPDVAIAFVLILAFSHRQRIAR